MIGDPDYKMPKYDFTLTEKIQEPVGAREVKRDNENVGIRLILNQHGSSI